MNYYNCCKNLKNKKGKPFCKILNREIPITATCVRVPVFRCHAESVNIEFENDFDVEEELEARFDYYSRNDWDELDAVMDLLDDGFVIDDFKYNDDRYLWIKEFAEDHGLI